MSRYSPTVLPQPRKNLADYLDEGVETYLGAKATREDRDATRVARGVQQYEAGVRPGTAPGETPTTITTTQPDPAAFTPHASSDDFAAALRGRPTGAPPATPAQPFTPASTADLATALRANSGPTGAASAVDSGAPGGAPGGSPSTAQPIPSGPAHPGAFDPNTHTFGGTPQRVAAEAARPAVLPLQRTGSVTLGPTGRYQQLDRGHYIDTEQTPEARAEARQLRDYEYQHRLAQQLQFTDPKLAIEAWKAENDANVGQARIGYYNARAKAAGQPRAATPDKPGEAEARVANTERARAETGVANANLAKSSDEARARSADRIVQALAAQNPGQKIDPASAAQYLGGLQRNGRAPKTITNDDVYAALDRYHNPPNKAETLSSVMAKAVGDELNGNRGTRGTATPPAARSAAPAAAGPKGNLDMRPGGNAARPPAGAPKPDARSRYSQLQGQGMKPDAILQQMQQEGYPPPPARKR